MGTWAKLALAALALGCSSSPDAEAAPVETPGKTGETDTRPAIASTAGAPPEKSLGVGDTGVFSDLDERTQIGLPKGLRAADVRAVHDEKRMLLVIYKDGWPLKVYPTRGSHEFEVGDTTLQLRPGDAAELAPLLRASNFESGAPARIADLDGDGIPNRLDVFVGALKTVYNGANYGGGYRRIDFPGGDIPREDGVCTDVVIRAVRNAGLDIQAELQRDIKRSPKSFPMVKKANPNIDHRRVKTMLPYFERQWQAQSSELDDSEDPLRPGDIIFMDTFPKRKGPDHIGIVSNRKGPSGHPLVINNWTHGYKTSEMDILHFVPITHRFRMR